MTELGGTWSACLPCDREPSPEELSLEREVFGANLGIASYTTVAQAATLASVLGLGPGLRLLDVGAALGWPSVYLAERTGCEAVLIDLPREALRIARSRARRQRVALRCALAVASGTRLPFRPRSFDAVLHTDVL
jgi:ubiquinone/menaquinone biosynthesis C-methylase UbiE